MARTNTNTGGSSSITTNSSLTGAGTALSPLAINLANSNNWSAQQAFGGGFYSNAGSNSLSYSVGSGALTAASSMGSMLNLNPITRNYSILDGSNGLDINIGTSGGTNQWTQTLGGNTFLNYYANTQQLYLGVTGDTDLFINAGTGEMTTTVGGNDATYANSDYYSIKRGFALAGQVSLYDQDYPMNLYDQSVQMEFYSSHTIILPSNPYPGQIVSFVDVGGNFSPSLYARIDGGGHTIGFPYGANPTLDMTTAGQALTLQWDVTNYNWDIIADTAGAALSIGESVASSNSWYGLFTDSSATLQQNAGFVFEPGVVLRFATGDYGIYGSSNVTQIGDVNGQVNGTVFEVNDNTKQYNFRQGATLIGYLNNSQLAINGAIGTGADGNYLGGTTTIVGALTTSSKYIGSVATFTPTTGTTITLNPNAQNNLLNPAGTLATLTISFTNMTPVNGQVVRIMTNQTITAVTFSGGTFIGAPTTLTTTAPVTFVYCSLDSKWHRAG